MTGKRGGFWLAVLLCVFPALLPAEASYLEPFKRMLILENGRIKPMDTFARNLLKQVSGRSAYSGREASLWLARVLFTPGQALKDPIFLVDHPDVAAALGIPGQGRQRCSFQQIDPGLERLQQLAMQASRLEERSRSAVDSEFLRLYANLHAFIGLLNAFAFTSGPDPGLQEPFAASTSPLAILPPAAARTERWLSPAEIAASPGPWPAAVDREISLLKEAARAFRSGQDLEFARAVSTFNLAVRGRLPAGGAGRAIALEIRYNRLEPFFKAQLAYGAALLLLLLSLLLRSRWLRRASTLSLVIGLLVHSLGLLARMIIMSRPPVTNLYETFVFVAWTCVLLGIVLELLQKNSLGILAAGVSGLLFLLIAGRYALEGDTLGMLAAVLDSNLWLATHVATISIGYAGCVVAGIIGHVYLVHRLLRPGAAEFRQRVSRSLYGVLAFGLLFTFIGTAMGGIWADQSWGRFWGWDPKENGALLIILWCAILFHARLAGIIGETGMAAGAVGSILTVVMAWFGVNLLGVGMHSYGFTSGIARGLLIFVAGELLFLAVALFLPGIVPPGARPRPGRTRKPIA